MTWKNYMMWCHMGTTKSMSRHKRFCQLLKCERGQKNHKILNSGTKKLFFLKGAKNLIKAK